MQTLVDLFLEPREEAAGFSGGCHMHQDDPTVVEPVTLFHGKRLRLAVDRHGGCAMLLCGQRARPQQRQDTKAEQRDPAASVDRAFRGTHHAGGPSGARLTAGACHGLPSQEETKEMSPMRSHSGGPHRMGPGTLEPRHRGGPRGHRGMLHREPRTVLALRGMRG